MENLILNNIFLSIFWKDNWSLIFTPQTILYYASLCSALIIFKHSVKNFNFERKLCKNNKTVQTFKIWNTFLVYYKLSSARAILILYLSSLFFLFIFYFDIYFTLEMYEQIAVISSLNSITIFEAKKKIHLASTSSKFFSHLNKWW